MADFLPLNGLQHSRLSCPSPTPGAYSNSAPSSWWCYPTISSSVIPFSSCLQSFPASGSFPMSQFFTSDGQSVEASASTSVIPMNIQNWFPLGLTGLISLQSTPQFQSINYLALSFLYKYAQLINKFLLWPWHNACVILVPWPELNISPSSKSTES